MTPVAEERAHRRVDTAPARRAGNSVSCLLRASWQLVAMTFLALALITGIVAMHSLVSSGSHSEMTMAATMSMGDGAATEAAPTGAALTALDCSGCGGEASMNLMWCVLALLTVALLLAAPAVIRGWGSFLSQWSLLAVLVARWARAVAPRPDLATLCISRT
ncbi:hypothetical protein I6E74_01990 [Salinibacterium sp. SWN139]|uniref:DUF6153 family protein n=1 Tax=Salinibacterium sp. SWN139 TaxID=2792055 RepID=UPI0018CF4379|nr:DUF6153 family protein [Salinibacterium sp. SWN139]MBH0052938.1 hypothetical protein [Salinibacterium sp. SWN139]